MYYNYAVFYLDILRTMASSSDVFFWGRFNRCWHQRSGCWFISPRCPDYSLGILGLWLHIASTVFCARPWVEGLELPDDDEDEEKVDLGKWLESMVSWNSLGTWYWWFAAWEAHLRIMMPSGMITQIESHLAIAAQKSVPFFCWLSCINRYVGGLP